MEFSGEFYTPRDTQSNNICHKTSRISSALVYNLSIHKFFETGNITLHNKYIFLCTAPSD